jgi:hypoxanthine phosphoribosyltransferase
MKEILTPSEIDIICRYTASHISTLLHDKEDIVLLCVLKGALPYFYETQKLLPTALKERVTWEFIQLSSYSNNKRQELGVTEVDFTQQLFKLKDKTVVIFEDIIDTGNSLSTLLSVLNSVEVKDIIFCSLLSKLKEEELPKNSNILSYFIGRDISLTEDYVIGFGLDDNQYSRGLCNISSIK